MCDSNAKLSDDEDDDCLSNGKGVKLSEIATLESF